MDTNEPEASVPQETQQTVSEQPTAPAQVESKKAHHPKRNHALVGGVLALVLVAGVSIGLLINSGDSTDDSQQATEVVQEAPTEQEPVEDTSTLGLFQSAYTIDAQPGCEESGGFVDVTKFAGPGGSYADPTFTVSCDGDELTVTSNNMPLWEFVALTPNALEEKDFSWTIDRTPEIAATPTQIGYQDAENSTLGDLGFTVSGLVWYGPTEGPQPDQFGDPFTNAIIDECGGHTGPNGEYHEHIIVTTCLFPDWTEDQPAPIVGYALDGFPIYGPTGRLSASDETVVELKSSYKETGSIAEYAWDNVTYVANQGTGYLDECNGRVQPDGSYGYHLTADFPYIIGCFKGTPTLNTPGGDAGGPPSGGAQQGPPR